MLNILITGSDGQLGSEIQAIHQLYPQFNFFFYDKKDLDITNLEELKHFFHNHTIDYIVNCAAYTAVDKAESEPELAKLLNATAVRLLLEASEKQNTKLIQVSTDYVFGGFKNTPISEDTPIQPESVYGSTKQQGEAYAESSNRAIVIRTAWLYSSFGHNFVKTIQKYGREKGKLQVVFDQVGTPTYAGDLAKVILDIIVFSEQNNFKKGFYHYANEGVISWYDFAQEICKYSDIKAQITPVLSKAFPTPAKRPAYSVLNKQKIRETFGLNIPYWSDSLKICIDKIAENTNT